MALKPRTFRRIILIGSLSAVVLLILVGNFVVRPWQRGRSIESMRVDGMAAVQAGDHVDATKYLGRYLRTDNPEPEYHLPFARARLKYFVSDGGHVNVAIHHYREYLKAYPDDVVAAKELLPLFNTAEMYLEARSLAEGLRTKHNDQSIEVLREERFARQQLDDDEQLIEQLYLAALEYEEVEFQDLFSFNGWLAEQGRADDARAMITARLDTHPQDVNAQLVWFWIEMQAQGGFDDKAQLEAYTHDLASVLGLDVQTGQWKSEPTYLSPQLVPFVDGLFNAFEHPELSLQVRLASARTIKDAQSMIWSARRLFWVHDFEGLYQLGTVNADDESIPDVFGYQILARRLEDNAEAASALLTELDSINTDFRAKAWRSMIDGLDLLEADNAVDARPMINSAIENYPSEPSFHMAMGDLHASQGRVKQAKEQWLTADTLSRGVGNVRWINPLVRVINAYTNAGRLGEGIEYVDALVKLAPQSPVSVMIWLKSYAALARINDLEYTKTQSILATFAAHSGELTREQIALFSPQIATMYASIDQLEQARVVLVNAIETSPGDQLMLEILEVDQRYELGIAESIGIATEQLASASPESAFRYALNAYAQTQDIESGLTIIDRGVAQADAERMYSWDLVRARYLDSFGDERAREAWITLRESHPDDIELLFQIAESRSFGQDLDTVNSVIDDIVEKTATAGKTLPSRLRLARASAIVGQGVTKTTRNKALEIVRSVVAIEQRNIQARNMLARLLSLRPPPTIEPKDTFVPDMEGAIEEFVSISRQLKGRSAQNYLLEAVDLSFENNDEDSARQYLLEFESRFANDYAILPEVASRLENINEIESARSIYASIYRNARLVDQRIDAGLALVNVYMALGQRSQIQALLRDLKAQPIMNGEQLLELASLYTKTGNRADDGSPLGNTIAQSGEQYGLAPLESKMVYAKYAGAFVSGEVYESTLKEVLSSDANDEDALVMLIQFLIRAERFEEAQGYVAQGLLESPEDQDLLFLSVLAKGELESATELLELEGIGSNKILVEAVEGVDAYVTAKKESTPVDVLASQLVTMLDKFVEFAPVQRFALTELVGLGTDPAQVAVYAQRAARHMPGDAVVMEIAGTSFLRASKPLDAMAMARLWRANIHGSPMKPDVIIGRAMSQLENYSGAIKTLEPYMFDAMNSTLEPQAIGLIHSFSHARIMQGVDPQVVAKDLELLLDADADSGGPLICQAWINLAVSSLDTHQEAARWLDTVAKYIQDDERSMLAGAWLVLIDRHDVWIERYAQSAIDLLVAEPLADSEDIAHLSLLARAHGALARCVEDPSVRSTNTDKAIALLDQANMLDPNDLGHLVQGAMYAIKGGKFQAAEVRFRKVLDRDLPPSPFLANIQNNLATVIERQGADSKMLAEAYQLSEWATEQTTGIAAYWGTRGWIELALNNLDEALVSFGRSVEIDSENLEGWTGLAITHYRSGADHAEQANSSFQRVLELAKSRDLSEDLMNRLLTEGDSQWLSGLQP